MGTIIDYNASVTGNALQKMANAETELAQSAKIYADKIENDILGNLKGTSVQKFMNQINAHCNNIATVAKELTNISEQLKILRDKMTTDSEHISRGGV